ncbi:MAG: flagellar hook-length control protein FliK [Candidatus Margulisbacteria bacterium]|nr:flagellar hook-length control protein FliK [Candidatus Margulisiibacteriota bacterium]
MKGEAVTIQFNQVDVSEPRLLSDSRTQKSSDDTFEDKLQLEQARLGLMFTPFSQFTALFNSTLNFAASQDQAGSGSELYRQQAPDQPSASETSLSQNQFQQETAVSPRIFDSLPLQSSNLKMLQDILARTSWLVPNLEAQPLFAQSFAAGKLLPKFDMQSLIDQLIDQIKLVKDKGRTELSLTMKPAELGEILLTITSRSGIISINIQAETETKKLINDQRAELELALKKAHIRFDEVNVEEVKKHA